MALQRLGTLERPLNKFPRQAWELGGLLFIALNNPQVGGTLQLAPLKHKKL